MSAQIRCERVFVVPRNGYANRLQAWASASILSEALGADLRVVWEPEAVAPATAADLFDKALVESTFATGDEIEDLLGSRHQELPRYLGVLSERDAIVLAGHDQGEQAFMAPLMDLLAAPGSPSTLVVIAGGKFHLPGHVHFVDSLRDFYRGIDWSTRVDQRTAEALDGRERFIGLHIRQTDRSREAPRSGSVTRALGRLRHQFGVESLYLATDTEPARTTWQRRAIRLGFEPWSMQSVDRDRGSVPAAIDALAEWRILARSVAIAYPAASTFSTEAAIAGNIESRSEALSAPEWLQWGRALRDFAHSAATYPTRRRAVAHRR